MSFSLFLRGLLALLLAFAVTTYLITGSSWTTFIDTVVVAILVQVGYFVAVLFLVWRSRDAQDKETTAQGQAAQGFARDEERSGEISQLPGVPRSRHP
jgi:exopolysaccharide production repressor protein